jgi:hypothetical protein
MKTTKIILLLTLYIIKSEFTMLVEVHQVRY